MSAKVLHSLTDENPDLHKQVGCMNVMLQLFNRNHSITGRRISSHNHKRLPPGQSGNHGMELDSKMQKTTQTNLDEVVKEKRRVSVESSRTSFSSSCSSTFSSVDCNRTAKPEPSSLGQINFLETQSLILPKKQPISSLHLSQQSLDLRDVVKDSLNREACGLSIKTIAKAERTNHVLKHIDSPRPLQPSKSDKPKVSGLDRSFPLKDTPRFSYDGRESRDTWKTAIKLKETPRLSLDSRQSSISRSASESRSNYLLDDRERRNVKSSQTLDAQQEPGSNNRRTSGVVAKLMGLEAFPDSMAANNDQIWMTECHQDEDLNAMSTTSRKADESKHNQASTSPRTQRKPSPSPQLRNTNYIVKPNSAFPLEPAPWRKTNGNGGSGKPASMFREAQVQKKAQNSYPSVYGQIEKRSTEIELKRSGKDLRDAMRKTRECLKEASDLGPHTRNDCTDYHKLDQNSMSRLAGSQQSILLTNPTVKGIGHLKNYESSGVFTKQAKVIHKTRNSRSSVISIEGMSSLDKFRTRVNANNEWNSVEKPSPNNLTPRSRHFREPYCQPLCFMEKSSNAKICKPIQTSKSPQNKSRDDPTSSGRSSTTVSPRLQQRKHGTEKQSSPTTKISDSSRFRRHFSKQQMESGSPSTKSKQTSLIELSSEARQLIQQCDAISVQSESNISSASLTDIEVSSIVRSNEIYGAYPHHCQRNNIEARLSEDRSKAETTTANLEQPSPVSVLDITFDREGSPSTVKKTSNAFKDESQFFDEAEWNPEDLQDLLNSTGSKPGSYFVQEQSENVKHLVHKLGQVNSIQDVPATEYVSSLCKNTNPAHKYITEILLASRLLFTDLVSSSTLIQPHPSCHLINPKLFLVLEQTKLSDEFSDGECTNEKMDQSKVREKINRKLIFDTVNEILFRKLSSAAYSEPWICPSNLGVKSLTGQKLLKEVCSEMDQLLAKPNCSIYDADDASISVLSGDMMFQTPNWEDSHSEIPGMVLDIERMIFKDLISEVSISSSQVVLNPLEQSTKNVAHVARPDQCSPTVPLPEKKMVRRTLKRKCRTMSVMLEIHQQHFVKRYEGTAKSFRATRICRKHGINQVSTVKRIHKQHGILQWPFRQSASSLDWPIGLPVGGHVVSLSKEIIVRKTFKRECRTISVSFEGHQQHFGSRCEDVANSPCVNRICEQHGISLVPTVKRIHRQHGIHRLPFRQGNSSGRERPVEVISVSTEEKLISRLQFLRMSLLGRSSLRHFALPSGSEFPRHIAFSSSELTSTNNRAYPGKQDQCGSSASHIVKERTRETLYREGTASHVFSFEHVQQHFGSKRKNDAKILGVCLSTFKRITRHHGIRRWPNQIRNNVWRSPDPHREKNLSPTFKTLSTNCPITMENDMGCQNLEPNELLPDSFEDLNFRNGENGSLAEIEKTPTFHDSFSGNCCEADICLSEYDKTQAAGGSFKWAFQLKGLTTQFTANPNLNTLVFPHPQIASTEVLSENMGSSEDGTKLLASQAERFLEGDVSECSNLTFPLEGQSMQATTCPNHNTLQLPQPLIALTQILNENMGSLEDWIASQQEPFLEGHISGSINLTVPTCSGSSSSQQPMPTTPYTMHRVLHMLPPLTLNLDASSVKMKATYRDTIIEFQLPLTSGSIELKEEVAKILKLEIDSFNVRYKDEEGEGDWILIPCDKDLRNYLQLFSSLVNPVIRLLVVDKDANLTNLDPMALKQPATFVESGIDPGSNGIVSDLLRFVSEKEICKKAGKAWTRFYLLYDPPGADSSSLITDMANYLEFHICYLDLRSMSSIAELKNMLLSTSNRSLIAIQDIDHCAVTLPNLKNELTVSCLLKYVDGLFLRCGDQRIIVFTTNHRDRNDAALLPLVNMDIYIPASSPQPIALPDGGEIVQLESSEQKPLVDFDATNNRECHSGILVSSSKNNNKREASKRLCMTESILSVVDPTTGISLTEFDAPNNGAHLVRACQGDPIMSNSEKKDTGEGLKGDFLTKSVLRLDDSTKQKSLPDCDATENEAHLLIAYQSCPDVSLLENSLENRNREEALKRECITKSILGLEDLQQHSGGRRDNAAKSFAAIFYPGIHTTNSLARKSFEVVETLRSSEQPSNATGTEREREIWTQMCLEQSDACGAHSMHVNTYARWFWAHLFLSLCHSVCVRSIFWEPDDFLPSLSLRRLTLKGCVQKQKSPYLAQLLQIIAVEPGPTKSPRYSRGSFAKSGTPLHWSGVLPDGGQVVSLSEKEIVRKTLKRKCRTTKVRRLEYHQLHFDSRCQDAAKRHGAKRICRQHVINQVSTVKCIHRQHAIHWWPFRQKWAMMKVYSLEGQRPLEVISPSTGRKLVSRLQVIHVSWLGRSSPGTSAIPGGGEIVGFIALSSSGFGATNNRANLLEQNPSGSTASHSNKKRRRDAAVDKGTNLYISEQDLRQHFGLTREEAARRLGVSVTTFKRHCRKHGILRWPCYRNRSSDIPGRPPDPDVVPPDFFDDLGACLETPISSFLEEIAASGSYEAAFLPQEQITVSFAYPTHNHPVSAQPRIASKEMASENTRSSDLTTQVEAHSEGHGSGSNYSSVPTFSNPALSQPVSTISETGPTVPQHISTIPGIGPSQLEARLEACGSGSSYLTVPTSSNPASTQPMSTIPETGPAIPQPVSTIPVTGPTIPHIMPPLIGQQDMRLVTIKAKYSDSIVRFKLPLTSGLTELNANVAKRLNLRLDSFDVEYRDEEGLWILISCDEDLRDCLQLFSSLDTPVIKLSVLDKVVNANERSGSLKRKRPWDA